MTSEVPSDLEDVDEGSRHRAGPQPVVFGEGFESRVAIPLSGGVPRELAPLLPYAGPLVSVVVCGQRSGALAADRRGSAGRAAGRRRQTPVTPALAARGLTKRYGDLAAVDALDLTVERGELFGFLGPNGAGKTTTIRMALGLILPSAGQVDLFGEPVVADRAPLDRVGALVEEPAFWKYLSGRKNLEYFARAGGDRRDRRARLARVDDVLARVGLTDAAGKRVKAYSQGMRQRLGLALSLLGAPELLVLDEPTNGLDPSGMREMRTLLRGLADDGTTIFVSSHLLAEVEAMCDRVGVMAHGRLVAEGPPESLRGAVDRVRLEVDDVVAARRVIEGSRRVHRRRTTPGPAEPRAATRSASASRWRSGASTAALNAALVSAGIGVSELALERSTLEDVFLTLVEGADVPR